MKAILTTRKGGPEELCLTEYPRPHSEAGMVIIRVMAFGINRAEIYMRKGEWGDTMPIIGIECVGLVEEDPDRQFKKGQKVAAVCGGMARTINGSYAEYTKVPATNVIAIDTALPWNELAAVPESYMTAWAILNWGLSIRQHETLLIRGATSTLGQACLILARQAGLKVIATTRSEKKLPALKKLGADEVFIDNGNIATQLKQQIPEGVHHAIELIGNSTLSDTIATLQIKGSICLAGFLGGLRPLENFQPLVQIPSCVRLTTFGSAFVFGSKGFELSKIPLQAIVSDIEAGLIPNIYKTTFPATAIAEAHRLVETDDCNGKVVVQW